MDRLPTREQNQADPDQLHKPHEDTRGHPDPPTQQLHRTLSICLRDTCGPLPSWECSQTEPRRKTEKPSCGHLKLRTWTCQNPKKVLAPLARGLIVKLFFESPDDLAQYSQTFRDLQIRFRPALATLWVSVEKTREERAYNAVQEGE